MDDDKYISSKPIPRKKYVPSKFSFNNPPNDNTTYFYELILTFDDNSEKTFKKFETKKYAELIVLGDKINYSTIKSFYITISKIPAFGMPEKTLCCNIDKSFSSFTKKDNDIFIEFSKNDNDYTMCTCYYIGVDFSNYFISPPN